MAPIWIELNLFNLYYDVGVFYRKNPFLIVIYFYRDAFNSGLISNA